MKNLANREAAPEFDALAIESGRAVLAEFDDERIKTDPILVDFRRLHADVGPSAKKTVASPESLLKYVRRNGRIPRISLVVDIYNLVSVETRLSLGAHDIDRVDGNISLSFATGAERFIPLGTTAPQPVEKGEYCYMDDADVLCRLEVRQADKTKLSVDTHSAFFMIQGNRATSGEYVRAANERLVGLLNRFCGGEARQIWAGE